jgi:pyruvate/2-oxoglutarate dehydrogenase complex dihydrolipoamide dehydrogenase (E3) component
VTTADRIPARLAIVGGGVVAVEMADAYTAFGARVTLIVRDERLLAREEGFAGELVGAALADKGVDLRFKTNVASAQRTDSVKLSLDDRTDLVVDEVLAATGRVPNTDALELGTVGVEPDQLGYVPTDDELRVPGTDWLYAIGDANGRNLLTHEGKYQGRVVADLISGRSSRAPRLGSPPTRVIFTDPQVAAIGHTETSAARAGLEVTVHDIDLESTAGSSYIGRGAGGRIRGLVDPHRSVMVGLTVVGPEVSEMLHAATIAIVGEVPLSTLAHAVPAFPTRNEIWLGLLAAAGH